MANLSPTSVSTRLAGVAVMVVAGPLAGCGQKGPLTLPQPAAPAAAVAPAAATASAPAVLR